MPKARFGVIVLCNTNAERQLTGELISMLIAANDGVQHLYDAELPDIEPLAGVYIPARRSHTGFLKLYGFLMLLRVKTLAPDLIEMSYGGQVGIYKQIAPYLFKQLTNDGILSESSASTIYFEMTDGKVKRISGDFLPLPPGHTVNWLITDALSVVLCGAFFLLTPIYLLISFVIQPRNRRPQQRQGKVLSVLLHLHGTILVLNNAALISRVLVDNYHSYAAVRPHILLNNLWVTTAILLACILGRQRKKYLQTKALKIFALVSGTLLSLLIVLLIKWQFLYDLQL